MLLVSLERRLNVVEAAMDAFERCRVTFGCKSSFATDVFGVDPIAT
jgi:hypothetical protein